MNPVERLKAYKFRLYLSEEQEMFSRNRLAVFERSGLYSSENL